jgi:hypothetical protein
MGAGKELIPPMPSWRCLVKVVGFIEIDGYKIVTAINEGSIDPEATKAVVAKQQNVSAADVFNLPNYKELFNQNKVYFSPGPNQIAIGDSEAAALKEKLAAINPHQKLQITGEIIPFYVGAEYWKQTNGKWEKHKIERIGDTPDGPLSDELTVEQQEEIRAQQEERRICCMTPEEKEATMLAELDALADEAARLEKRNQIQGTPFDPAAWYQERESVVRQKYT